MLMVPTQVFDIRGRYGTYGKVDTITITKKKVVEEGGRQYKYIDFKFSVCQLSRFPPRFVRRHLSPFLTQTLSPGSREIERNGCVKVTSVDGDLIMLVASSNSNRWKSVKETIAATISTFSVAKTPKVCGKPTFVDNFTPGLQSQRAWRKRWLQRDIVFFTLFLAINFKRPRKRHTCLYLAPPRVSLAACLPS